jgi:hypothetical protein
MQDADASKYEDVFSWSLWFKSTSTNGDSVARILARDASEYVTIWIDQSQSSPQPLGGDASGSVETDKWHHIVLNHYSDVTFNFWLNGSKVVDSSSTRKNTSAVRPWVIGGNTEGDGDISGNHFIGKIDDVRMYNRVLSEAEINRLYNKRTSLGGAVRFFTDSFEDGSFSSDWNTPNAYIQNTSYDDEYSMGSWGNGPVDATWQPSVLQGGKQIKMFSYWWQEDSSQTGHQVRLYDSSGNKVQHSETENPQWQLTKGDGSISSTLASPGYNRWTFFEFKFDWNSGTYDYYLKDSQSGKVETGTFGLINSTDVEEIRFVGTNGKYCRFDKIRFQV